MQMFMLTGSFYSTNEKH